MVSAIAAAFSGDKVDEKTTPTLPIWPGRGGGNSSESVEFGG